LFIFEIGEKTYNINLQNIDAAESVNINIMSTNRTLNSQQMSKNNLNLNSKIIMNNLVNSKTINNNFNTFSPKEANTSQRNLEDLNRNFSSFNYGEYNFNIIKYSEDYITGFELLNKVLCKNNSADNFSTDKEIRTKFYYSKLISNLLQNKKFIRSKTRSLSNKSNKSTKAIVSDRYEDSNKNKGEFDSYIDRKNSLNTNDDNTLSSNNNINSKYLKPNNNFTFENKSKNSIFNFNIEKLTNSISSDSKENFKNDNMNNESNYRPPKNKKQLYSFLKYSSKQIKENSSDEEEELNENGSEDETENEENNKLKKQNLICKKENLYLAKIIVKNCTLFYKRNKIDYSRNLICNLRENARWNKILSVLHKNVLTKQFFILDCYFSKLKKISYFYRGMEKLNKIVYKYMRFLFNTFGHQTRVIYIVKKNLYCMTKILSEVDIRKKKFLLLKSLWDISVFRQKLPFYELYIAKICKIIKRHNRRKTFLKLKKYYYALKIYTRNMQFLVSTIDSLILDVKRGFIKKFQIANRIHENLKTLVLKKHLKRLLCIKKGFRLFIENSLNSDEGIYKRIKLKKVFTIYSYKLKFQSIKVKIFYFI